jgi:hypothetical protein
VIWLFHSNLLQHVSISSQASVFAEGSLLWCPIYITL